MSVILDIIIILGFNKTLIIYAKKSVAQQKCVNGRSQLFKILCNHMNIIFLKSLFKIIKIEEMCGLD